MTAPSSPVGAVRGRDGQLQSSRRQLRRRPGARRRRQRHRRHPGHGRGHLVDPARTVRDRRRCLRGGPGTRRPGVDDQRIRLRPRRRDAQFYRDKALSSIPLDGALAVAVPGAPAALAALHARRRHHRAGRIVGAGRAAGRERSAMLGQDRVRRARGVGRRSVPTPVWPPSIAPRFGRSARRNPAAPTRTRSLDPSVGPRDPDGFYVGEFAERAVAALRAGGAPFSGDEWAAAATVAPEPAITGRYAGAVDPPDPAADARVDGAAAGGAVRRRGGLFADG